MNWLVKSVSATANIGVVGVFVEKDAKAPDNLAKNGELAFDFGTFRFKRQSILTRQANVKACNRKLRNW
jgi:glutathione-independent formaldehyde dehydrogenase